MPTPTNSDDGKNPADEHYKNTFNRLNSAEHESGTGGSKSDFGSGGTLNKLNAAEQSTGGVTGQDTPGDTLGQGYSGSPKGQQKLNPSKKRQAKTVLKGLARRKSSYFVAAILAGIIGVIIGIMSMASLKLIATMDSIDNIFSSAENQAMDKMSQRMLNRYIVKDVIKALGHGECRSTMSPKCVVTPTESGPIGKLYRAWADQKLEYKLADQYGLIFGSEGNGTRYYMSVDGSRADLHDVINGKKTIFEVGAGNSSPAEIRRTIDRIFKDATLWDKTYTRYKVSRYLSRKVGLPRCVLLGCTNDNNARDKLHSKTTDWRLAAKASIVNRVVKPISPQYGLMVMCILDPGQDECKTSSKDLDKAESGDTDRETKAQKKIATSIASSAAKLAGQGKDVDKIISDANKVSEKGARDYIIGQILEKIGLEAGTKTAVKAIPVIGWIILAAEMVQGAIHAGPIVQHMAYGINSMGAMALYQTYDTMAAQQKNGNVKSEVVGSFSDSLATNMDPNAPKKDQFDMTATPIYKQEMGTGTSTGQSTLASLLLGGTAYADSNDSVSDAANQSAEYGSKHGHCDGGGLPDKALGICSEEVLATGSAKLNSVSDTLKAIPGLGGLSYLVEAVVKIVVSPFSWLLGQLAKPFVAACHGIPKCDAALAKAQSAIGDLINTIVGKIIHIPYSAVMNGARIGTMLFAGADVTHNDTCKNLIGCQRVSDQTAANIQQQQLAEAKKDFQSQPLFARLFSTDTPYSLVSRIAIAMPGGISATGNTIANTFFRSPMASFGNLFGSIFQTKPAFAAGFNASQSFGIDDYAYTSMPNNPYQFWNNNCVEGPYGIFDETKPAGQQLDVSPWLNNDTSYELPNGKVVNFAPNGDNVGFNDKTGQSVFLHSNPCMLIYTSAQASGAMFDPSLIPADDNTINSDSSSGSTSPQDKLDMSKIYQSSVDINCAQGSKDIGVQDGYYQGKKIAIRACALNDVTSGDSGNMSRYGLGQANGKLVVNSRISAVIIRMVRDARADGVSVSASSGFRTMAYQQCLYAGGCGVGGQAAKPGWSNHQMGLAVDWTQPMYNWMAKNGSKYGFYAKVPGEPWHWSPSGH